MMILLSGLVAALFTMLITSIVHRNNREAAVDPVLVFYWDPAAKCWIIENVGNGPALNVYIAAEGKDGWTPLDKGSPAEFPEFESFFWPALAKGAPVKLTFKRANDESKVPDIIHFDEKGCLSLKADYWSSLDRHLLSTTSNHQSKRIILNSLNKWHHSLPPHDEGKVCRSFDYKPVPSMGTPPTDIENSANSKPKPA